MKPCLIIEDSDIIREIVARMVRDLGYEPLEAGNVEEALQQCRQHEPSVVMLDWDLPAMEALDFLREISLLQLDNAPAIILCATENDPQQFTLAKAAGAEYHLIKPFDQASIKDVFGKVDAASQAQGERAVS